jgi:hypothetical protein
MQTALRPSVQVGQGSASAIRSILTQDLENRGIALRDAMSNNAWEVGDLANDIFAQAVANSLDVTKQDCCYLVARDYTEGEYAQNTVRIYSDVASFFGKDIRERYHAFPFAFFRKAKEFGDSWEVVFLTAQAVHEAWGYIPPLPTVMDVLEGKRERAQANLNNSTPAPIDQSPFPCSSTTAQASPAPCGNDTQEIAHALEILRANLMKLPGDSPIQKLVAQVLVLCQQILSQLAP